MRHAALVIGLLAFYIGPCEKPVPEPTADAPPILAAGNLNNLYVAVAARDAGVSGFRYWQRDAQGMWHEGRFARGSPAAVAAWREDLLVFFPSGRWGRFGLGRPVIEPSPVQAWTPVAACEDGTSADAFGYNSAGDPFYARYQDGTWTAAQVEAGVEREKMMDPRAVRFGGRLFLLWREEVPTLTGPAPDVRLRFLTLGKDGWHGPITSRLRVGSALHVAADDETMVGLFLKDAPDQTAGQWMLATYAVADEDWHEIGPVTGTVPRGPVGLGRSGRHFFVAAIADAEPVVAPLDVAGARVGEFMPVGARARAADGGGTDYGPLLLFIFTAFAALLILASWRRGRAAAPPPAAEGQGQDLVHAPLLRRAVAIGIDYLAVSLLVVPVMVELLPEMPDRLLRGEPIPWREMAVLHLVRLGVILVYFMLAEAVSGRTPGKALMRLQVRSESGARISVWQALVRTLLRPVDELPALYLVGLVLILTGAKRQRLGDRLAHTIVVMSRPPEPAAGS